MLSQLSSSACHVPRQTERLMRQPQTNVVFANVVKLLPKFIQIPWDLTLYSNYANKEASSRSEIRQVTRGSSVVDSHSRSPTFHRYARCYRPTGPSHSARGGGSDELTAQLVVVKKQAWGYGFAIICINYKYNVYIYIYECGFAIENIMIWRNLYAFTCPGISIERKRSSNL